MIQTAIATACHVAARVLAGLAELACIGVFAAAIGLWAGIWTGA